MASALGHDFVGFLAVFGRHNIRPPSLCEQSELQCFASGLRRMFAQRLLLLCRYAIWFKNAQRFFYILNTLPNRKLSIRGRESCYSRPRVVLPSAASSATCGRESTTCQAFQEALSLCKERCDTPSCVSHLSFFYKSFRVGAKPLRSSSGLTSQTCACAVRWALPPEGGRHREAGRQSAV